MLRSLLWPVLDKDYAVWLDEARPNTFLAFLLPRESAAYPDPPSIGEIDKY
jgi:hypothetical protein